MNYAITVAAQIVCFILVKPEAKACSVVYNIVHRVQHVCLKEKVSNLNKGVGRLISRGGGRGNEKKDQKIAKT